MGWPFRDGAIEFEGAGLGIFLVGYFTGAQGRGGRLGYTGLHVQVMQALLEVSRPFTLKLKNC